MSNDGQLSPRAMPRRDFLRAAGLFGVSGLLGAGPGLVRAGDSTITLPFDIGERPLMKYPQKRPI